MVARGTQVSPDDLAALVDAASTSFPGLDRRAFSEHLARAPDGGTLIIADLALAFMAAQGDQDAVNRVYATVERAARPALAVARYPSTVIDDAVQETATRLLVGPVGEGRPLLLTYQGRAPITTWIKTIALRTAARLVEIGRRMRGDDGLFDELAGAQDPAAAVTKAELKPAVRAAFAAAVKNLSYVDREILASVILRGESIEQLSRRHDVHRSTAARWVGRARAALDDGLRRELATSLDLSTSEVSGVLEAVATSIELTPDRLAGAGQRARR